MRGQGVSVAGAACLALALCGAVPAYAPTIGAAEAEEAPAGMVTFVAGTSCPPGWSPATTVAGRLLVGTDQMTVVGQVVGEELGAEEDRPHSHALTGATIALPSKAVSASDGTNQSGASSGVQPVMATIAPASSSLPFIQLTTCVSP